MIICTVPCKSLWKEVAKWPNTVRYCGCSAISWKRMRSSMPATYPRKLSSRSRSRRSHVLPVLLFHPSLSIWYTTILWTICIEYYYCSNDKDPFSILSFFCQLYHPFQFIYLVEQGDASCLVICEHLTVNINVSHRLYRFLLPSKIILIFQNTVLSAVPIPYIDHYNSA